MGNWGIGNAMLIMLAGLQGVPTALYDAAKVDGANVWQSFRNVTFPMISPVIFFNLLLEMINAFQVFASAFGRAGITAQVTGQGSLMRLHLTDRRLTGYRTIYPMPEEAARMIALHRHLLNAGHYISTYGMICLSTATTKEEVDALIADTVEGLTRG